MKKEDKKFLKAVAQDVQRLNTGNLAHKRMAIAGAIINYINHCDCEPEKPGITEILNRMPNETLNEIISMQSQENTPESKIIADECRAVLIDRGEIIPEVEIK